MKKFSLLILIIIFVVAGFFFLKNKNQEDILIKTDMPERNEKLCFVYQKSATQSEPYSVKENLEIKISGEKVSGVKNGTQSGPDMTNGYEGLISGTIKGDILDVVFSYEIEGSKQKEQEKYLLIKDGIMKLRYQLREEDGILVPDMSTNPKEIIYNKSICLE
ncbi:MAG: hypothetical protein QG580_255 [Patescibacteria group bacterium]|jgi:hypothetical protein|nr:hypothetical protein [Patescibacteria group bacterium]